MYIIDTTNGQKKPVVIRQAEKKDFRVLTEKRYFFAWKKAKKTAVIYKLHKKEEEAILGAMALIDVPGDKRTEIALLASSIDNKGKNKMYDRIAGCLIAFAGLLSVDTYGEDACVSLTPKTELIAHYMRKYYMHYGGRQLYLEGPTLRELIKEYST
jgi:hypothetical protein